MGLGLRNVILQSDEKYEYMFFSPSKYSFKQNIVDDLNKLGADGWEVIGEISEDILLKKKYVVTQNTVN
jgi:hypothetical protein